MQGSSNRDTFTITWDAQSERLDAPNGKQYLPCEDCGTVLIEERNVVSALCSDCYSGEPSDEEGSNYAEQFQYAAGYPN